MGEVVELSSKEELFNHTLHPYTRGLISSVPIPDPTLRERKEQFILEDDLPDQTDLPSGCRFYTRCPFRKQKCKVEKPEFRNVGDEHFVSCHYPINVSTLS